jgi:hypothetical protein
MIDDTDKFIKDNLLNIIDGKFNDKFNPEQLKMMLELSFLYNHTTIENESIIFNYNGSKLVFSEKLNDLWSVGKDTPDTQKNEWIRLTYFGSTIRNDELFKSSLIQFLRDKKINDILK